MSRLARSPAWAIVALLLGLYLAHDLGAKQSTSATLVLGTKVLRVDYIPDPKDVVNLVSTAPFVVPVGKTLIVTDWSVAGIGFNFKLSPRIRVDGADAWAGFYDVVGGVSATTGGGATSGQLKSGIRASEGQVVSLAEVSNSAPMFATGYLADAQ